MKTELLISALVVSLTACAVDPIDGTESDDVATGVDGEIRRLAANGITGTYSGPNGSGNFSVLAGASSKAYCGTYGVGTANSGAGVWNFTVNGESLVGSFAQIDGKGGALTGTVTGDKVDITWTEAVLVAVTPAKK